MFRSDSLTIVGNSLVTKSRFKDAKKPFKVFGIEQFLIEGIEFANARLIRKPSGFYIQVTCYAPKIERKSNYQTIGIDFGRETSFTTYVEETQES